MCVRVRKRVRERYEEGSGANDPMLGAPRYTGTAPARESERERERVCVSVCERVYVCERECVRV